MGPLSDAEMAQRLGASAQVKQYAEAVDRESAREMLAERATGTAPAPAGSARAPAPAPAPAPSRGAARSPSGAFEKILRSPTVRTVAGQLTRGILGALLGKGRRGSSW